MCHSGLPTLTCKAWPSLQQLANAWLPASHSAAHYCVGLLPAGMDCPRVRYPSFNDAVEADLAAAGYQVLTGAGDQVDKVVQLYEVLMTRHTVMVVGQTGGGKSVILNTLAHAQTAMGRRTMLHVLNPKAITVAELYGVLDKDTRDWTDGLLSNMFR